MSNNLWAQFCSANPAKQATCLPKGLYGDSFPSQIDAEKKLESLEDGDIVLRTFVYNDRYYIIQIGSPEHQAIDPDWKQMYESLRWSGCQ